MRFCCILKQNFHHIFTLQSGERAHLIEFSRIDLEQWIVTVTDIKHMLKQRESLRICYFASEFIMVKNIWRSYIWTADNFHYCLSSAYHCEDHFHSRIHHIYRKREKDWNCSLHFHHLYFFTYYCSAFQPIFRDLQDSADGKIIYKDKS